MSFSICIVSCHQVRTETALLSPHPRLMPSGASNSTKDQKRKEKGKAKRKLDLNAKNNSTLIKEQSHVAGEIERSGEPPPGRHIELATAPPPQLADGRHRPLERLCVEGHPIANRPKVCQIEGGRPLPRDRPHRHRGGHAVPAPPEYGATGETALPEEHGRKDGDPEDREKGPVGGDKGRGPALEIGLQGPAEPLSFDHRNVGVEEEEEEGQ